MIGSHTKQETCIMTNLKRLNAHKFSNSNKIDTVRAILNQLSSHHRRFQNLCDENQKIQICIHKSCVNKMVCTR